MQDIEEDYFVVSGLEGHWLIGSDDEVQDTGYMTGEEWISTEKGMYCKSDSPNTQNPRFEDVKLSVCSAPGCWWVTRRNDHGQFAQHLEATHGEDGKTPELYYLFREKYPESQRPKKEKAHPLGKIR